jgi:pimeloyl-ACP methyl ester carboxylesterase
MSMPEERTSAINAKTQFIERNGRTLAYRSIGTGKPIVLCTRFRGNMDVWDPAFLDALASNGFGVITFDHSGLGLSTGEKTYDPVSLARDAKDLIEGLELKGVVISGWSLGVMAALTAVTMFPERISHALLIGTTPPGPNVKPAEQLFYDTAVIPEYGFEDEVILFFEPRSRASREAARRSVDRIAQRKKVRSVPVPVEWAASFLGEPPPPPKGRSSRPTPCLKP